MNTPPPGALEYWYEVTIDTIKDGDTFTAWVDYGFGQGGLWTFRMIGVNTPEIHTSDKREKALGLAAKDWLGKATDGQCCMIESLGPDKYGRLLCRLFVQPLDAAEGATWLCVNDRMIEEGIARYYDGGPRGKWFGD